MMRIGIDFGQTSTYVAELLNGKPTLTLNSRKSDHTSSVVAIIEDLPFVADEIPKYRANEENIVSRMKGIISRYHDKRLLEQYCKDWRINVAYENGVPKFCLKEGKGFTVEEIVALLFSYVTQGLKNIEGAVITVPSSFDAVQRQMIRNAAAMAKVKVFGLIEKTTAAAKACAMIEQNKEARNLLVFQMGGSTIDIAIFEVTGTEVYLLGNAASSYVGGDDFDKTIMDDTLQMCDGYTDYKNWIKLLKACEKAKIDLGIENNTSARINIDDADIEITESQFKDINKSLLNFIDNMIDLALIAAQVEKEQIKSYILVGKSSLVPSVSEKVAKRIGKDKHIHLVNTGDAAAIGAGYLANKLMIPVNEKTFAKEEMGHFLIKENEIVLASPYSIFNRESNLEKTIQSDCDKSAEIGFMPCIAKMKEIQMVLEQRKETLTKDIIVRFRIKGKESDLNFKASIKKITECATLKQNFNKCKKMKSEVQSVAASITLIEQMGDVSVEKSEIEMLRNKVNEIGDWLEKNKKPSEKDVGEKQNSLCALKKKNQIMYNQASASQQAGGNGNKLKAFWNKWVPNVSWNFGRLTDKAEPATKPANEEALNSNAEIQRTKSLPATRSKRGKELCDANEPFRGNTGPAAGP